ncbi:lipopolysaccharide transport periplasmic protein LptA [Rhodocyclus tenuis]|uniref:lipopolysaccharide transport periplasmic protein LptA n=1 Tax=Rhodocyclus tenuis TaxID=1066 RepID=UPI0019047B27|nr:lipopolysaccharide transport periplasmic protein LptA [Rhodocyclus tenuis]MBK1680223.1 lipopolysaccharide transport periplasmic protein LptA [Rhodocyclus tenuis]
MPSPLVFPQTPTVKSGLKPLRQIFSVALFGIALAGGTTPALAERADREKPINLEADRISVDDIKKVQIYEGAVVLTQGTLQIRTDRLIVTQDADGFQRGKAIGGAKGLARFRQKREGKDEYVEGEGETIEHDARNEKTEFFVRAWVKNGADEVRGNYIAYDSLTEKYLVTAGSSATGTAAKIPGVPAGRVRAVLMPKSHGDEKAPAPVAAESLTLKPAQTVRPREE